MLGEEMVAVLSFDEALKAVRAAKHKHLLLGNGFSIALKPDIFTYGSLYENADFSKVPQAKGVFQALKTQDFEAVIRHLLNAAAIAALYRPDDKKLADQLKADAASIKDVLVAVIAKRHPDRPFEITPDQYAWSPFYQLEIALSCAEPYRLRSYILDALKKMVEERIEPEPLQYDALRKRTWLIADERPIAPEDRP